MADPTKHLQLGGGSLVSDIKNLFSIIKTRRTVAFAYGFMFAFVAFTVFLAFSPSSNSSSPWFLNIFSTGTTTASTDSYRSQFSSIFSYFFPNGTSSLSQQSGALSQNFTSTFPSNASARSYSDAGPVNRNASSVNNSTVIVTSNDGNEVLKANQTANLSLQDGVLKNNSSGEAEKVDSKKDLNSSPEKGSSGNGEKIDPNKDLVSHNITVQIPSVNNATLTPVVQNANQTVSFPGKSGEKIPGKVQNEAPKETLVSNFTTLPSKNQSSEANSGVSVEKEMENLVKSLANCNLFDGRWVRDDSYPLYKPGSCSLIDEQFNCIRNGRPDWDYQKMKWKPNGCTLPRMNGSHFLELIRGKRLVFVGDSLNRNMWESLICILRNSVKNWKNVYEANGRVHFRGEASYSFIFKDYNCTVEFFVSPFLVREWEMPEKDGSKKETLRLDLVGRSCDMYKDADFLIFNTGHWWTHEKTSKGKDYYQEGSHVYGELNVLEAFRKALTTWARWVDANVNPEKSMVFFRGYSASHFSGGQWNSGGACDSETEPIRNDTYLTPYPPKMLVLESVLKGMKTHVTYLNITRLTDYRKDGHPSVYRRLKVPDAEKREPLKYQDCSHWCLPGVPDAWNELLYAELLVRHYQKQQQQKQKQP